MEKLEITDASDPANYLPNITEDTCPKFCPPGGPSKGCELYCAFSSGDLTPTN